MRRQGGVTDPPPNWHALVGGTPQFSTLLWHGLATVTRSANERSVLSYVNFLRRAGGHSPFFPANTQDVANWIADEAFRLRAARRQFAQGTLKAMVGNLASWHVDLGLDPAPVSSPLVHRVIRGAYKLFGTAPVSQPLPITLPVLQAILKQMRLHPENFGGPASALALRAAFALAFACFLRMSEFTYVTFDRDTDLRRASVDLSSDPPTLSIPASKTDPFRKGVTVAIPEGSTTDDCPRRLLRLWLYDSSGRPDDALFYLPGHSFSRTIVCGHLASALVDAGYDPSSFSGHSFRRGAATWAASIGIPDEQIQRLGRWAGSSFNRYIDAPGTAFNTALTTLLRPGAASSLPADGLPPAKRIWRPL